MENKCGLPWIIVTLYKGSYGTSIDAFDYLDFDDYSKPTKDKSGRWLFSLNKNYKPIAMVRCKGKKALNHALSILDELEQRS